MAKYCKRCKQILDYKDVYMASSAICPNCGEVNPLTKEERRNYLEWLDEKYGMPYDERVRRGLSP